MKFTAAVLLAAFGLAGAKKLVNKKAIMRGAVAVDKNGNRRLEEEEFEISGDYTLQFNHCLSLKIAADNYEDYLFADETLEATYAGKVLAQTSYVLFNVCKTGETCYYEDDENLYMVDLPTYMGSVIEGAQQKKENFCQACEQSYDSCYDNQQADNADEQQDGEQQQDEEQQDEEQQQDGEQDQQDEQQQDGEDQQQDEGDQQENQDEGERRLEEEVTYYDGQGYIVVACDTCIASGCFEEDVEYDDGNWQVTDQGIEEWVNNMIGCVETEAVGSNGEALYSGFMCNSDGSGVEPAMFMDENCAVYTSLYSYYGTLGGTNDYLLMEAAADVVTAPFLNDMSCEYIEYMSIGDAYNMAYEQANQEYNGEQQNQEEEEEAPQASELCQQVFNDALDMDTCGGYEDQDEEEEDVEEDEDEDYSWYSYLVAADAADDAQGSCVVVAALQGEFSLAHTYTEEDGEGGGSGHYYDYKSSSSTGGKLSAGTIFGIVIAVIVVIVAAVLIMQSMGTKKDTKKVPLVSNKGGAMA